MQDHTYLGVDFKKGSTIAMPRRLALQLCQDEIAVSNEDVPCSKRGAVKEEQRFKQQVEQAEDKAMQKAEIADMGVGAKRKRKKK